MSPCMVCLPSGEFSKSESCTVNWPSLSTKTAPTCGNKYQTLIRYRERIGTFRSSYQRNFTLDSPRTLHKIGNRNRRKQLLERPTVPNSLAVLFVKVLEVMLSIPRCTRMAPPLPTKLMTPLQHLE